MIIDTHIHLDSEKYHDDLDTVIKDAIASGVEKFIIPGANPDDLEKAIKICENYDNIFFTVGAHPYHWSDYNQDLFEKYIVHDKCVGVGECGLDYYRLPSVAEEIIDEKKSQKEIFIKHIELANKYNKPLVVHIRDASYDALEILQNHKVKLGGVLHCFNADEQLLKLVDSNFYFGIGGVLTFKNAKKLVNILPKIPFDKLLIETDGPYLTPHPHRGERNEPQYCTLVVSKISELLDICEDEIKNLTTNNALKLFLL